MGGEVVEATEADAVGLLGTRGGVEEARAPVFRSVRSFHSAKQPPRGEREVTASPPEPAEGEALESSMEVF